MNQQAYATLLRHWRFYKSVGEAKLDLNLNPAPLRCLNVAALRRAFGRRLPCATPWRKLAASIPLHH